jgi:hypothetical protein
MATTVALSIKSRDGREPQPRAGGNQIASGTIMIAPHGHSWAHSPQPLQKS